MKLFKHIIPCLILLITACGPRVDEQPPDFADPDVVEDACVTWCEVEHQCCAPTVDEGRPCGTWKLTEEQCVAECVSAVADFSFNDECRDDYYTNIHCASTLTCEEYVDYQFGEPGHVCEEEKDGRFEMLYKGCFG